MDLMKSKRPSKVSKYQRDPPRTNAWFTIEDTADGPKISPIFHGLKQDAPIHSRAKTGCALVGSKLYVICGRGAMRGTFKYLSNQIRFLNTKNLNEGWKTKELSMYCSCPTTIVSGDSIYLFPYCSEVEFIKKESDQSSAPWGYIYDTIEHDGHFVYLPEKYEYIWPMICVPLGGHGVRVPMFTLEGGRMEWFDHKGTGWEKLDVECASLSENLLGKPYAVSSDTLYIYDKFGSKFGSEPVLHAYKISSWSPLGIIYLPEFAHFDVNHDRVFIVPVADFELCFLWYGGDRTGLDTKELSSLYYAMVSICLDHMAPTATLLKEAVFVINAVDVINCLPYDSFSDHQNEAGDDDDDKLHMMETDVSGASSSRNQNKQYKKDEFWNTRIEQNAALCKNFNSTATVLKNLFRSSDTFTQIPFDAQPPPKKKKLSYI